MIKAVKYYEVVCDCCGTRLENDGMTATITKQEAIDFAEYCEWTRKGDKFYCPTFANRLEEQNNPEDDE